MIKKIVLIILPMFLFSGCFLLKSGPTQQAVTAQHIDTLNTKLLMVKISSDCYDCDTFTVSIRNK